MAKKLPIWFEKEYPDWKQNLWGAFRAFTGGFLGSLATCLITVTNENILSGEFWLRIVLVSSFVGGFVYLGKWLRDKFYDNPIVQKLPI